MSRHLICLIGWQIGRLNIAANGQVIGLNKPTPTTASSHDSGTPRQRGRKAVTVQEGMAHFLPSG